MVEHSLGKGGVVSPILTSGTIQKQSSFEGFFCMRIDSWERTHGGKSEAEQIVGENK